ncbi:hypothetical protein CIP107550_00069 [Corynebacterium diphtheriae]|nr:hypothetical protein CIP107550_00069 [Corynebacterium diphtheriae]
MALRGAGRFPQPWLGWDWVVLVGVGGRATPAHPRKRRHFTPNPAKRPVWKRFGVKFCAKCLEIPPNGGSVEPERPSVARPSGYVRVKPWAGTAAAPARPTRITRTMPSRPPMLALPPFTPEKTALHTKSSQTAGLEAIWCEVRRKILRNTPVWWLSGFRVH